ncbi:MAG TPA: HU family DNA-binding protein [Candidatus Obscuribacterales bacterium]
MNRAELISEIAELTGQPKTEVSTTLTGILYSITNALSRGEKVTLVGFGTFERRNRQARTGRNPRTLAPLRIPSSRVPAFRAGQELKDTVDGRKRQKAWAIPGQRTSSKKSSSKSSKGKKR